jgi:hypothetical protein
VGQVTQLLQSNYIQLNILLLLAALLAVVTQVVVAVLAVV